MVETKDHSKLFECENTLEVKVFMFYFYCVLFETSSIYDIALSPLFLTVHLFLSAQNRLYVRRFSVYISALLIAVDV